MNCPHCQNHIRQKDIEDTIFNMKQGFVSGDISCRKCYKFIPVQQKVVYVVTEKTIERKRKDDKPILCELKKA